MNQTGAEAAIRTIKVRFPGGKPSGPRVASDGNWAGQCVVCGRADVLASRRWLDNPGVYVLAGERRAGRAVYVGQADSVADRLETHLKQKDFWSKAAAVFRQVQPLHRGHLDYLEAKLIGLASSASTAAGFVLVNQKMPAEIAVPGEEADMEAFLGTALFFLAALDFDFFAPPRPSPALGALGPPQPPGDPPAAPGHLAPVIAAIRDTCLALPHAEFYRTNTPDSRAKVTSGGDFRVFARLAYRRNGVKLELMGEPPPILVASANDLNDTVKRRIAAAHARAEAHLAARGAAL